MNLAWIPNTLTMGNLVFGFLSIVYASKGQFVLSGFLILFAALFDGFDGQVARFLKVESRIGAELDSLADCITFGVAPGYLAYSAYFCDMVITLNYNSIPAGAFLATLFPVCGAYRLARFNVSHDSKHFCGLPSPIAGIAIALVPISANASVFSDTAICVTDYLYIFVPAFVIIALLMISTMSFSKPQAVLLAKLHGIKLAVFIIVLASLLFAFRKYMLFIVFSLLFLYVMSALISFVIQIIQDFRVK
ncbi:MAG: CDP-diacylglycerol--serine O-phosphatidyltransferase [Spirochaetes bacterium]|nr:CDP-diacylglycerol--serine O-phosphatidyltransferase [Spirochaetota bacterium]MBN2770205.1 CDP-diacylglycerol--serine O-phosphatidyltransferase [Spirochaetota bacterium]